MVSNSDRVEKNTWSMLKKGISGYIEEIYKSARGLVNKRTLHIYVNNILLCT